MLECDVKKFLRRESSSQSWKSFMSTLSPCTFCTARGLFTCNLMRMSFTMIPVWCNVSLASLLRTAITHIARFLYPYSLARSNLVNGSAYNIGNIAPHTYKL